MHVCICQKNITFDTLYFIAIWISNSYLGDTPKRKEEDYSEIEKGKEHFHVLLFCRKRNISAGENVSSFDETIILLP